MVSSLGRQVVADDHELTGKNNGLHDAEGVPAARGTGRAGCGRSLTARP